MLVRQFRAPDLSFLHKCELRHGLAALTKLSSVPINTFVVSGVALASIRAVEGGFWLMDGLITNPLCSSAARHCALKCLYEHITKTYSPILAWSTNASAMCRAKSHGFEQLPQYTVLRYLKPE